MDVQHFKRTPLLLLTWVAFEKGKMVLAGISIALSVALLIFYIILLSKFGGKNRGLLDQRIDKWIYGNEGTASIPKPEATKKKKLLEFVISMVFGLSFLGTMWLGQEGYIAVKYTQPVAALFVVPWLVLSYFLRRPKVGPLTLICPILYVIHAILIVAGVPIFFTGNSSIALNMSLPFLGYTVLAYAISHFYSRYALKKLKGIAHLEGEAANGA